ncbi:MAG: hydrogenase iron-sulfur subunit [Anaerolineae bacterium]|jgi:F420-non-reducing hydrogenase iron-sulfur subunit
MTRTAAQHLVPTERPTNGEFSPKILGFLCNWCSYAGADLAGVSRFQYPPTLRIIRVMCSGRVDPVFVLRAFSRGVDGVMVLGCHPGDCHYTTGNYYTRNRVQVLKQTLELAEIDPDRLVLDWVSAGEGGRFASLVTDFTGRVQALGPLGQSEGLPGEELAKRLATAQRVVESEKVRWLVGRKREMIENGNIYGEAVDEASFEALLQSSVATEYLRNRLLILTDGRPLSVKEMAGELGVAPRLVLPHVAVLEQAGLMAMVNIEGNSPKYQRM